MVLGQLPGAHLGENGLKLVVGNTELARTQETGMDIFLHAEEGKSAPLNNNNNVIVQIWPHLIH